MKNEEEQRMTEHRLIAQKPKVQALIEQMRLHWKEWESPVRRERLVVLKKKGCTIRGLAGDTGIPESTLRQYSRDIKSWETWPTTDDDDDDDDDGWSEEAELQRIRDYSDFERSRANSKAVHPIQTPQSPGPSSPPNPPPKPPAPSPKVATAATERRPSNFIDCLVDDILTFYESREGLPKTDVERNRSFRLLLQNTRQIIESDHCPKSVKVSELTPLSELLPITQPLDLKDDGTGDIAQYALWLATILISRTPHTAIIQVALGKLGL